MFHAHFVLDTSSLANCSIPGGDGVAFLSSKSVLVARKRKPPLDYYPVQLITGT
jgi:hypothetical protein